ncbi:MAG TPA: tetratricopeptide repeat protein [Kofleriaceae bacterium]|nr:tetratricopeptide repeat protein [Kofleriaceae bacterium]
MSHRTPVLVIAIATAAVTAGSPARAQQGTPAAPASSASNEDRARALHAAGLRYYEAGQYGRAISSYRKAYALVPAPGILFNLAQAYRLKGDCRHAYRAYRNFLHANPDSPQASLAREHSDSLRSCAKAEKERTDLATAGGATAGSGAFGGAVAPPAASPSPQDAAASPPEDTRQPLFAEPPIPPPGDTAAGPAVELDQRDRGAQPGRSKKLIGVSVGAAGAVLTAVGVYYGLRAHSAASDLSDFYDTGGAWTPELADREDSLGRNRTLAIGFGLIGTAAIGTGAAFYWLGHREATAAQAARHASMSILPQPQGGAVLQWRGAF